MGAGAYRYEPPTGKDIERDLAIDRKFRDLELGLVDASIAALAERLNVHNVLTIDSDFVAIRVGPGWHSAMRLAVPIA